MLGKIIIGCIIFIFTVFAIYKLIDYVYNIISSEELL